LGNFVPVFQVNLEFGEDDMCGVLGLVSHEPVNQLLYDGLQMLQHRGQDAAGIVTAEGSTFHMHKGKGMVREVFRTRNMRDLIGNAGIAHVRYPTAGNAGSSAEAQPFYVSSPFGIVLAHNGNLTNTAELYENVCNKHLRHVNTSSDSEVLLNVFAHELRREVSKNANSHRLNIDNIFNAVAKVHRLVRGAYGVVAMIAGYGMLAFRDPYGIRPLVLGQPLPLRIRLFCPSRLRDRRRIGLPIALGHGRVLSGKNQTRAARGRHRRRDAHSRHQPSQRDGTCRPPQKALPRRFD